MKRLITILMLGVVSHANAQNLTEVEKAALLKEAQTVLQESQVAIKKTAVDTNKILSKAADDKQKCLELYYDAIKEVNFLSKGKSSGDFQTWKSANRNRISNKSNIFLIQSQVKWLNFSLLSNEIEQGGMKKQFVIELTEYLDNFFEGLEDVKKSSDETKINLSKELKKNITQSEIAIFLSLNHSSNKKWPSSPTKIADIYNNFIFPYIRELKNINLLKSAWEKRINQEAAYMNAINGIEKKGLRASESGIIMRQFETNTKPNLLWQMCIDLYKNGAQQQTAQVMLKHIRQNRAHPNAAQWANQLIELLTPKHSVEDDF